jgi:phospholipid N-methyltransferase
MNQVAKKKLSPQAPENKILFLREYFLTPHKMGAIVPSSTALAREIVRLAHVADSSVIVEYGAGTGSFTKEILRRKRRDASFLAIESNPCMVEILRQRFPDLTVLQNSVEDTPRLLQQQHLALADCIVSGLPWSSFSGDLQDRLLEATLQALRPSSTFVTFAYPHALFLPGGIRFRRKINRLFSDVAVSNIIWNNLPPALIYHCVK